MIDRVSELIPVEIKFKTRLKAGDLAGLRYFLEMYGAKRAYLVSLREIEEEGPVRKIDGFNVGRLLSEG